MNLRNILFSTLKIVQLMSLSNVKEPKAQLLTVVKNCSPPKTPPRNQSPTSCPTQSTA